MTMAAPDSEGATAQPPRRSAWHRSGYRLRQSGNSRVWAVEANDGIVATAGLLEGFAGAGANDAVMRTAAIALTVAGSLALGGAKWAEEAAERDTQIALIAEERDQLSTSPDAEVSELAAYWESKGLDPDVALQVAQQLSARDALAAHLEYEHGITAPMPTWHPWWSGVFAALAYISGAMVPLTLTSLAPVTIESWAILLVTSVSLVLTSIVAARTSGVSAWHYVGRSLIVGVGTLVVSFVLGLALL